MKYNHDNSYEFIVKLTEDLVVLKRKNNNNWN